MMPEDRSEDRLDSITRISLNSLRDRENEQADDSCLSDEELAVYVDNIISNQPQQQEQIRHTIECDHCFERIASAVSALTKFNKDISIKEHGDAVKKAKSIPRLYRRGKVGIMKRNRYLLIAAGFFALSFIFKVYFLQFLLAALVFGLKWVMDTGGSKALIMIYDTWQQSKRRSDDEDSTSRMKDRF